MKFNLKQFVSVTIPIIVLMLIVLELILWLVPVENPYTNHRGKQSYIASQFKPYHSFRLEPQEKLPFIDSKVTASFNNYGFRGEEIKAKNEENEYRIFLVGGSTTECILIDDKKANHTLLQRDLSAYKAKVFNAGKSGDITSDHIAMLSHRIVHLNPKLVVLFCGINDLYKADYDYTHTYKQKGFYDDLKTFLINFQLFRRFYHIHQRFKNGKRTSHSEVAKGIQKLPDGGTKLPLLKLSAYETNLKTFVGICKANDIALLLVTQATTWASKIDQEIAKRHWMTTMKGKRYSGETMNRALEQYNDVMRKIAKESNAHLYDLAREIPKSSQYFYDDCHFNNNGAQFYATRVGAYTKKYILNSKNDLN